MDIVLDVVRQDLAIIIDTGWYLLGGFFLLAAFTTYIGLFSGTASMSRLILSLILGCVMLTSYTWIMDTTLNIVEGVDLRINGNEGYFDRFLEMGTYVQEAHEETVQNGFTTVLNTVANFGKETLHNFVVSISFMFFSVATTVMMNIRACIIGILYKIGPLLMPFLLFQTTRKMLRGWFTSYVAALSWPIIWKMVLGIAVGLADNYAITESSVDLSAIEPFVALNFAVGFVVIFSPMIITSLANGIGAGVAASLAGVGASRMAFNTLTAGAGVIGHTGHGVIKGGLAGATQEIGRIKKDAKTSHYSVGGISRIAKNTVREGVKGGVYGLKGRDLSNLNHEKTRTMKV